MVKQSIKKLLEVLHLDVTKNMQYDRQTKAIFRRLLAHDSNAIDVGCHKGEMLELILSLAPNGSHFAFEPIPYLFHNLEEKYGNRVQLYSCALANEEGMTTFQLVKNAPAYSGIKQRKYDIVNPDIEEIKVDIKCLDNLIPSATKIDLIKIDVEGAELGVLKGAMNLLKRDKPVVLFEFGLGASDFYGTTPADMYNLLVTEAGMRLNTLKGYLKNQTPLSLDHLKDCYLNKGEYYFVAF